MKYLIAITFTLLTSQLGAVTLNWDQPVVSGYKLHWGPTSGAPANHLDVGNILTKAVDDSTLGPSTYFTVTVYNANGVESLPSNEVLYVKPQGPGATFVIEDATTKGSWKGVYGDNGRAIRGDSIAYPAWAAAVLSGTQYTWAASTTDVRALQKFASATDRIASTWYGATPWIDLDISDGNSHRVAVYFLDWDTANTRSARVDVVNAATGQVFDTRTVSGFRDGKYLVWDIRGHVKIMVTRTTGSNAVISGLFL